VADSREDVESSASIYSHVLRQKFCGFRFCKSHAQILSTFRHAFKTDRRIFQSITVCSMLVFAVRFVRSWEQNFALLTETMDPFCATCCTETLPFVDRRSSNYSGLPSDTDLHSLASLGTVKKLLL
jgi:hypothetical protein